MQTTSVASGVETSSLNTLLLQAPAGFVPPVSSVKEAYPPARMTLEALFRAYFDCRKHKRNTLNQLTFEIDLEKNLMQLWRELNDGTYVIGPSIAFVVTYPKVREVWAADFRDRVVHHLIYNAIRPRFERAFIRDSYACIPGRGVHDGCKRISSFARSITRNYTRPAYALKLDVANFFNSIDRRILQEIVERRVEEPWLIALLRQVIWHDPRPTAIFRSTNELFQQVPPHKSLLRSSNSIGLPIGNLTSQFFANVYMNELDQFAKHALKAHYYGRYVDDFIFMHEDPKVLVEWGHEVDRFLKSRLGLRLHPNKIWLNRVDLGIDFTGFVIKPGRTYLRNMTMGAAKRRIHDWEYKGAPLDDESLTALGQSLNSYMGMLRQVNGYRARRMLCNRVENLFLPADKSCTKFILPPEKSYIPEKNRPFRPELL